MNVKALLVFACLAAPAMAQGFAGLGSNAEGFSVVKPGYALSFPADHGSHPDYRIEWWYLTSNLRGSDGKDYGVQWTLFRSALSPTDRAGWSSPQVWMGHAAITTSAKHFFAERFARGGIGQAGVIASPFSAWIDNWQLTGQAECGGDQLSCLQVHAGAIDFSYDLKLRAEGPLVLHGQQGYSVKSSKGQSSYYYSQPFYSVTGELNLPDGKITVSGQAWLDREWSSQPLASHQTGWDWFSFHFASGDKLMAFRLRDSGEGFTSATWIGADGRTEALAPGTVRFTPLETFPVAGRNVPIRWRVEEPGKRLNVETSPLNKAAWMNTRFPYWEGPISFSGSHEGRGYLEMTGYN